MIDIRLIRENPELVRENIRKKFQDAKLPLVDEVIELDKANRAAINEASNLRAERNTLSKQIGMLMGQAKKDPSKLAAAVLDRIFAPFKTFPVKITDQDFDLGSFHISLYRIHMEKTFVTGSIFRHFFFRQTSHKLIG